MVLGLGVALYLATKYGLVHCLSIPYWCEVYSSINTAVFGRSYPSILVVSDSEEGDTVIKLFREHCNIYARLDRPERVSPGELQQYDAVVVFAKTLSFREMEMFYTYATRGGKLVWIMDSGTEFEKGKGDDCGDFRGETELANVEENVDLISPWDRALCEGGEIVELPFGREVLGLYYVENDSVFELEPDPQGYPSLVSGLTRKKYSTEYAVVKSRGYSAFGDAVIEAYSGENPLILRYGYRVFYYAFPPWRVEDSDVLIYNLCRALR